ncbi:MAG TPA: TIGR02391 family protein [Bryobacteraceae bacterium]|nr:TIGR02391 family protein [Bryobacteraceae bacterium]
MVKNYISINRRLRSLASLCRDAVESEPHDNGLILPGISDYVQRDVRDILRVWPFDLESAYIKQIGQRAGQKDLKAFQEILSDLLPQVEDQVDDYFASRTVADLSSTVMDFLHPAILESSYSQFRAGKLRDSVFNAFVAVFDLLRTKTGLEKDGAQLVVEALSLERPRLVISTLATESGRSEQKGFIQILQGAYLGVRNPKAHSLASDLDEMAAAQYLVFASLLARRIDEAQTPTPGS